MADLIGAIVITAVCIYITVTAVILIRQWLMLRELRTSHSPDNQGICPACLETWPCKRVYEVARTMKLDGLVRVVDKEIAAKREADGG